MTATSNRVLSTALSLLSAFAIAGCTSGPEATLPVEEALTTAQQQQLVHDLAFDPSFVAWAHQTIAVATKSTSELAAQTPAQRMLSRQAAAQLVAEAGSGTVPPATLIAELTSLTGTTDAELQALNASGYQLVQRFPGLPQTGQALIGQAVDANPELRALAAASQAHRRNVRGSLENCLNNCTDEYIHDHNQATWHLGIALAACVAAVWLPPLSAGCFVSAAADAAWEEADAEIDYDNCVDNCNGIEDYGECRDDSDCKKSEYCDTGFLSIGDNKCKPDKGIGKVCSRDEKCTSGCCKYDFWQNPIEMTCNPASDCN